MISKRLISVIIVIFLTATMVTTWRLVIDSRKGINELLVYVPSVLQPVVYNFSRTFEQDHNVRINIFPGPVGSLINRIELTEEGDVLITPDHFFMVKALEKDLVLNSTVRPISYVVPALIISKTTEVRITSLQDLAISKVKVGIADPNIAGFGRIAFEILQKRGIYEKIKDRLLIQPDIVTVARQVATGVVDVAILPYTVKYWYQNDVDIVWLKPEEIGDSVTCQLAAIVKYTRDEDLASYFISELGRYLEDTFMNTHVYAYSPEKLAEISPFDYTSLPWPNICRVR